MTPLPRRSPSPKNASKPYPHLARLSCDLLAALWQNRDAFPQHKRCPSRARNFASASQKITLALQPTTFLCDASHISFAVLPVSFPKENISLERFFQNGS